MKNCHVCNQLCADDAEVCVVCGAYLDIESAPVAQEQQETKKIEPVLLATISDVVSAEIFKDILISNNIPYSCIGDEEDSSMRVVFGGGFSTEEIYVDSADYDKANELYSEFLESEPEFDGEFFDEEFTEEE